MKLSAFIMLPLVVATVSCGSEGTAENPATGDLGSPAALSVVEPSNDMIMSLIYDPDYSVPNGFFVDERASIAVSYSVHHVLDPSNSFELCSDDFAIAEALEQADNESRSVSGYFVGAYENDRYFEFIRELSYDEDVGNIDELTSPGFSRVFKCTNTSRDGVDRSLLSGYAGQLNSRPLRQSDVSEFAEYLWQFAFFPARQKKVLDSYASSADGRLSHTLLLGFASTQGDGRCDLIEVVAWRFRADSTSGRLTSEFELVRSFEAETVDGIPRLCS